MPAPKPELTRDEKVENLILNFSMIMMGMFEGAFEAMAAGFATAMSKTSNALAETLNDFTGSPRKKPAATKANPEFEVNEKVGEVFSGLRKQVAEGFSSKDPSFMEFIKNPTFDGGVLIVESHRLKLPKLTERLGDAELADYVTLIQNGDPDVGELMKELSDWQQTTPKFGS